MRFEYISVLALCGASLARDHQYCACQSGSGDSIDIDATTQLQNDNSKSYLWAQTSPAYWFADRHKPGPRFAGIYLKAANGKIDGDTFYNLCINNGGADSTCFDCSKSHQVRNVIYCDAA